MILNLLSKIIVALIGLIGFVISPIVNLIPEAPFVFINNGLAAILNLINNAMGFVSFILGDYGIAALRIVIALRILSLNQATVLNILKKIPYIKSFFKE